MTHPIYTEKQLSAKTLEQLKAIASQLGCTPSEDKRIKANWVQAIVNHQSTQVQQVAQAELNAYIEQQAQEVAAEVEFICIDGFYNYEAQVGREVIARISYDSDDFVTQPWVVMVSQTKIHHTNTLLKAQSYIQWHYRQGTLPEVQQLEQPQADNAVLAQISVECEKFGLELWDEGIFHNDVKLGEVGCTNGNWWVIRTSSHHQLKVPCNSAFDAVWALCMNTSNTTKTTYGEFPHMSHENTLITELLDKPFDEVTPCEWRILANYEPQGELVAV